MIASIDFDEVHDYDLLRTGITLPVQINLEEETEEFEAKLDTGSTFCIFRRAHGRSIGLDIETGLAVEVGTPTGSFRVFGHEIALKVLGLEFFSTIYFAESEYFDRNVLGRTGFLDRVKLGVVEPEGKLYLSRYQK